MGFLKKDLDKELSLSKKQKNKNLYECIKNDVLNKDFIIIKRIGRSSTNGENYLAELKSTNKQVVIKKVPLTLEFFQKYKKNFSLIHAQRSVFLTELIFLQMCKILINNKVTPLLPYIYSFYICKENCNFINKRMLSQYSDDPNNPEFVKGCGYIISKKADGDLADFFDKYNYNYPDLLIAYYNIFSSLLTFKRYTKFFHGDLHYGNILFHKINKVKGVIKYKTFNNKIHMIPNTGFLFYIWDFGLSRIYPYLVNPDYDRHFEYFEHTDDFISVISRLSNKISVQRKLKEKLSSLFINAKDFNDFLDLIYLEITKIAKYRNYNKEVIDTFNLNKKFKDDIFFEAYQQIEEKFQIV